MTGSGTSVRYWVDPWEPKLGPLKTYITPSKRSSIDCLLKDMVTTDGTWNLEAFRQELLEEIV